MFRITRIGICCGLAVVFTPALVSAQVFIPAQSPPNSPFGPLTPYRFQPYAGVGAQTVYGNVTVGQQIPFNSPLNRITNMPFQNWYARPTIAPPPLVPWSATGGRVSTGYMSGGTSNSNIMQNAQREFDRAQRDATTTRTRTAASAARNAVDEEWNYEKFGTTGLPGGLKAVTDHPDELIKALSISDESDLVSGHALNQILVAVIAAESKGAKGPSSFLTPQLITEVRFAGAPAADAINFLMTGGRLVLPIAFDDPKLKEVREELEADFLAVSTPLRDGKLPEPMKLMKLGFTLKRAQELASPVIQELPFDAAVASRRFLNRFELALTAFKAPNSFLMFNPAWSSEGGSIGELVKHMTKLKIQFGPVGENGGDSYLALHKALSNYLFVLTQPKK
ncbi:MAG: hypothetical protein C0467_00860 [Planctomycetaceae bacterium]|nr:hypothetical protein [Planctomycetaceae bacterium]